jgi:hypothetical protein
VVPKRGNSAAAGIRSPCGNCPAIGSRQALRDPKISQLMNSRATELSSRVVMISFVRRYARASAGTAIHSIPPRAPAASITSTLAAVGRRSPTRSAAPEASTAPRYSCPSAPMFHSLTRKLTSAASPVRISGVALTSVSAIP